jgi:hypothetical protein
MSFSLGVAGGLTELELDSLVDESNVLPHNQMQLRHLWATLKEARLVRQPVLLQGDQLQQQRVALATSMDTSLHQWEHVYSKGYKFWLNIPGWEGWEEGLKRFHIKDVLEECKEVLQGGEGVMEEV